MDPIEEEILSYCNNEFEINGNFQFNYYDILRNVSRDVPNEPGIYLVFAHKNNNERLVYIGEAGTMLKTGQFKRQKLLGRLNNRASNGESRQQYFRNQMIKYGLDYLTFYWFVTYCENNKLLPAFIEAKLLQMYFELSNYQKLPEWNEKF